MQNFSIKSVIWHLVIIVVCVAGIFGISDTWSHNYEISLTEPTRNFVVKELREEKGVYFVTLQGVTQNKSVTLQRNVSWDVNVGTVCGATWNCIFQRFQLTTPQPISTDNDDDDWWFFMLLMS